MIDMAQTWGEKTKLALKLAIYLQYWRVHPFWGLTDHQICSLRLGEDSIRPDSLEYSAHPQEPQWEQQWEQPKFTMSWLAYYRVPLFTSPVHTYFLFLKLTI
jgi:hypothetical protein